MTFRPEHNLSLVALRAAWRVGPDERDLPDWITHAVDSEGTVKVRPMTLDDVLAWVERECEGEVE
jgi:hypothetical protein